MGPTFRSVHAGVKKFRREEALVHKDLRRSLKKGLEDSGVKLGNYPYIARPLSTYRHKFSSSPPPYISPLFCFFTSSSLNKL